MDQLTQLEQKSIYILREAYSQFKNLAIYGLLKTEALGKTLSSEDKRYRLNYNIRIFKGIIL